MRSIPRPLIVTLALIAAATLLFVFHGHQPVPTDNAPTRNTPRTDRTTQPPDVDALLPVSRADLATVADLAARFATTYETYRYDEPTSAYLARLRPQTTPQLSDELIRSATAPGLRSARAQAREYATARATPHQFRAISPGSVIIVLEISQTTVSNTTRRTHETNSPSPRSSPPTAGESTTSNPPPRATPETYRMHPKPQSDTGEALTIAIIAGAALLVLVVVFIGAATSLNQRPEECRAQPSPGAAAGSIPSDYLGIYQHAGRSTSVGWNLLAAIGKIETDHGRSQAPGVHSGANYAGAAGPMQFGIGGAAGNTWGGTPRHHAAQHTSGYATDGNHDGWANVYDPADAIPAAAHYLKAHGAPGDVRAALFAYNRSTDYVNLVMTWANRYATHGAENITAAQNPTCERTATGPLPNGAAGKVITYARAQLGKPYVYGAEGPGSFDCSGLTMMAYRTAGITIPRTVQAQWATEPHIQPGHEQPGDLVFFPGSDGTPSRPGHVGVVTGRGHMIAAPHTGTVVQDQPYTGRADLSGFARPR